MKTPFQQQIEDFDNCKKQPPSVNYQGKDIPFVFYQVNVHYMQIKLMAQGIHFRGIQLKDFKSFYGLKGRTIKQCKEELEEISKTVNQYYGSK